MAASDAYEPMRQRLFRQAALRGTFSPRDLLNSVQSDTPPIDRFERVRLLSALREACTVRKDKSGETWLMRPAAREKALSDYQIEEPDKQTEIGAALSGDGPYQPGELAQLVEQSADVLALGNTIATLERAGAHAPGHALLLPLRSRLNVIQQVRRTDALLGDEFLGRQDEVRFIESWLDQPQEKPPLETIYIQGVPGIGKSFLLENIVRLTRARPEAILVRLDFDRSALQVGENSTVFEEISRQIGDAIPQAARELRHLRLEGAERQTEIETSSSAPNVPHELLDEVIRCVSALDRRIVFLLDTLEKLHGQGVTFVERLMRDLDRFAMSGKIGINVISAGRGPLYAKGDERLHGDPLHLDKLEDDMSRAILRRKGVPESFWPEITRKAKGNPLRITLYATQVRDTGTLGDDDDDAVETGYLYRAIRSRVPEGFHDLAQQALILPSIDTEILAEIVAPALDLPLTPDQAGLQLRELHEQQDWLVRQNDDGSLSHRPEMRQEILEMLYKDSPQKAEALNRSAATYWAGRDPVMHLYHVLQLTRASEPIPQIEASVAQRMSDALLRDLPADAQDAVRHARGERSAERAPEEETAPRTQTKRASRETKDVWLQVDPNSPTGRVMLVEAPDDAKRIDKRALEDARVMLEKGEHREASHIVKHNLNLPVPPDSDAGLILLTHQWRTGHWSMAHQILKLLPVETLRRTMADDPGLTGRVMLELWAEFRFTTLVRDLDDPEFHERAREITLMSSYGAIQGGALDFALLVARPDEAGKRSGLGVLAPYMPDVSADDAFDLRRRAESFRTQMGIAIGNAPSDPSLMTPFEAAIAVAPMNPYVEPMRNLLSELEADGNSKILNDIMQLDERLSEATELFLGGVAATDGRAGRMGERPSDVIERITALGFFADWAEGHSFFHAVADLPTIAHAAERWRKTSAGQWAYGRTAPEGWASEFAFDSQVDERARALLDQKSPEHNAIRTLRFWADPLRTDPQAGWRMMRYRLLGRYTQISGDMPLEQRLEQLQTSGVAGVRAAALGVLAHLGVPSEQVFQDED